MKVSNSGQRSFAVANIDDFMAIRGEQLPEQRTNAVGIVGDEDATMARRGRLRFEFDHVVPATLRRGALVCARRHRHALMETVTLKLTVERAATDAEQPRGDGLVAADLLQRADDVLAFHFHKRRRTAIGPRRCRRGWRKG